ncbi:hypothetical protein TrVE_jg2669 [Triparma verrucosa]|uniref:Myb-like domain-containing protein n=1 Tax=Triparma verrucosa TaxID=1606542 RepID=A0A9W7BDG5_9STRA|nr:hypothetical protein TrVE_jg2669 [Triparma verrucosa]
MTKRRKVSSGETELAAQTITAAVVDSDRDLSFPLQPRLESTPLGLFYEGETEMTIEEWWKINSSSADVCWQRPPLSLSAPPQNDEMPLAANVLSSLSAQKPAKTLPQAIDVGDAKKTETYSISLNRQELGIKVQNSFTNANSIHNKIIVKTVLNESYKGLVEPGHWIQSINGVSCSRMGLRGACEMLNRLPRPVRITFGRRKSAKWLEEKENSEQQEPLPAVMPVVVVSEPAVKSKYRIGSWTDNEQLVFLSSLRRLRLLEKGPPHQWKLVQEDVTTRSLNQIKSHAQKVIDKVKIGVDIFEKLDRSLSHDPGVDFKAAMLAEKYLNSKKKERI